MSDYRDRPPVDTPRPTIRSALASTSWGGRLAFAALLIGCAVSGFMAAVAGGVAG